MNEFTGQRYNYQDSTFALAGRDTTDTTSTSYESKGARVPFADGTIAPCVRRHTAKGSRQSVLKRLP